MGKRVRVLADSSNGVVTWESSRAESYNFLTDSCKCPTNEITGDWALRSPIYRRNSFKMGNFQPQILYFGKDFSTS